MVRALLNRGVNASFVDNLGRTPLHLVLEGLHIFGHDGLGVTQLLVEHGTDVNAQDRDNKTPLHLASYYGKIEIARMLLDHGANVSAKNALGLTPLHKVSGGPYISSEDSFGVARLLLERCAEVNARDSDGATPLDFAIRHWRMDIASLLLQHGGQASAKVYPVTTPLQLELEGVDLHNEPTLNT